MQRLAERPPVEQFFTQVRVDVVQLNISGSVIANLAVNSRQTIDRIDQQVGRLRDDPEAGALSDALVRLTKAVAESPHLHDSPERQDVLDGIEALLAQAAHPPAERRRGVFKPIIEGVARACSAAGGLAAVWAEVAPAVRGFFGL